MNRFNGDHAYDDVSIKCHHIEDSSIERVSLWYEDFGTFDRAVTIGSDPISDDRFYEHHCTFYKFHDDQDSDEVIVKKEVLKDDVALICSVMLPYVYSGGKNIKKIPLIVNSWPELSQKILSGRWL